MDLASGKKSVGKEHSRKIGVHPLVKVGSPGEEVSYRIRRAGNVLQSVVEVLEELDPAGLAASDFLRLSEILEVFVVGADANRVLGTEEERATTFEAENNTKELFVVGVVIGFRRKETAGVEGNGMQSVLILLGDDYPESVAGGIGV
jgi:hypothetical protein